MSFRQTKIILIALAFFFVFFGFGKQTFAATYYWVGANNADVNSAANWTQTNPTAGNCVDDGLAGIPGSTDTANFDADCDNSATVSSSWTVLNLTMSAGYTGALTESVPVTITVNTALTMASGATLSVTNLTLSNGNNISTITSGATLTVTGTTTIPAGQTFAIPASGVTIQNVTVTTGYVTITGGPLVVNGDLTMSNSAYFTTAGDIIHVKGNITTGAVYLNSNVQSKAAIIINGTSNQTWTYNGTSGGYFGTSPITVNKSSGTLTFSNNTPNFGTFTLTAGTTSVSSLIVSGTFAQSGGTFNGGSGDLSFSTFSMTGGIFTASSGNMNIIGGTFSHTVSGTFNHASGTVVFKTGTTITSSGDNFNNVLEDVAVANGSLFTISGTMNVLGTFTKNGGGRYNGGTINLKGDIYLNKLTTQVGSNGTSFVVNGSTPQSLIFNSSSGTVTSSWTISNSQAIVTYSAPVDFNAFTITAMSGSFDLNGLAMSAASFSQSAGTFNMGTSTLNVPGAFTLSGGTFNAGAGTLYLTASFTHTSGGVFNASTSLFYIRSGISINTPGDSLYNVTEDASIISTSAISLTGTINILGTFNKNGAARYSGGTWNFYGPINMNKISTTAGSNSAVFVVTGTTTQPVMFSPSSGSYTSSWTINNSSSTVTYSSVTGVAFNAFILTNGTFNSATSSMSFAGAYSQSGGTFNNGSGSITFASTFSQSGGTFNNDSGAFTVAVTFTQSGGVYNGGTATTSVYSSVTLSGGTFNAGSGTFFMSGYNLIFRQNPANTFNAGTGSFIFQSTGGGPITASTSAVTFYDVTNNAISGGLNNSGSPITVTHNFSLISGSMSTGVWNLTGPQIILGGGSNSSTLLNINGTSSQSVTFTGGGVPSVTLNNSLATVYYNAATTFNNLNIQDMLGTFSIGSNNLTTSGTFTQSGGVYNGGTATTSVYSSVTLSGGTFNAGSGTFFMSGYNLIFRQNPANTFNAGTGSFIFQSTGGGPITASTSAVTFYDVTNNAISGGLNNSGNPITVTHNFSTINGNMSTGVWNLTGPQIILGGGSNSSTLLNINGTSSQSVTFTGGVVPSVTLNNSLATVYYNAATTFASLTLNNLATSFDIGTKNFTANTLTVNSGSTFSLSGDSTVTVSTPVFNSGSTVEYTATSGTRAIKVWTYTNATLSINGAGGTFTLPTNLTVANLNIAAGTLSQGSYNITLGANGTATVGANGVWSNVSTGDATIGSGGVSNSGIISFASNGSVSSSTKDIVIQSTTVGNPQRPWTGNGVFSMINVNVRDQGVAGGPTIYAYYSASTSNNGSNWIFVNSSSPNRNWKGTTAGSNTTWGVASNWVEGSAPDNTQTAIFSSAYSNPAVFNSTDTPPLSIQITGGYNSIVTLGQNMSVGSYTQSSGTFDTGNYGITSSGAASLSGGTLNAKNGANYFNGGLTISGGTFDARTNALTGGLVGYWKLDESSGSSATDSSGLGNTGTLFNSPTRTSSVPTVNFTDPYALTFNGTSQYVGITNGLLQSNTQDWSIAAFFKTPGVDPAATYNYIYSEQSSTDGNSLIALNAVDSGSSQKLRLYLRNSAGTASSITSTAAVNDNTWHHAVATKSGNVYTLFLDGVQQSTVTSALGTITLDQANIAARPVVSGGSRNYFNGSIDDVRVYSRALSQAEITALAAGNNSANSSSTPSTSISNLTLSGGTYYAGTTTVITGNFTNSGGTFNAASGTVSFTGTTNTITGTSTFYNLTKAATASSTLIFGAGQTTTVTGTTTLTGTSSSQLLYLRSSASPTQWKIDPRGGRSFAYLDVKDSNNISSTTITASNYTGLTDASGPGSNTNWVFTIPEITVSATGTQQASTTMPVTAKYMGGAFLLTKNSGTSTITSIALTQKGSLSTNDISNIILSYANPVNGVCSNTTSVPSSTPFNSTTTVSWVNKKATTTGSMTVGAASPVCVYVRFTLSGHISLTNVFNTIDLEITNPSTDIISSGTNFSPATAVNIYGVTVVDTNAPGTPAISLSIASSSMSTGQSTTITWTATQNPSSCSGSGDWSGYMTPASGGATSTGILNSHRTYTFTLSCTNTEGVSQATVSTVVIDPRVPTLAFSAASSTIASGTATTLSWTVTDGLGGYPATLCLASGPSAWSSPSSKNTTSGTGTTGNLTVGAYFTLACGNQFGTTTKSVLVNVSGITSPTYDCTNGLWVGGPYDGQSCDSGAGAGNTVYGAIMDKFILRMADPTIDPTKFIIMSDGQSNALYMVQGPSETAIVRKLTAEGLNITNGSFTKLSCTANDCKGIKIHLDVQKTAVNGSLQNYTVEKTFKTTADIRKN